ncbi:MAG: putative NADPH-quinone reductase [Bacteriovoracaceae bacterium]|jgi:NAD(P)H dehydrogenase (quinone)
MKELGEYMNILIINGHPDALSFTSKIAKKVFDKSLIKNPQTEILNLYDLVFNPIFKGFTDTQELEPDLKLAQEKLKWADHIVITTPIWWSTYPALLKGFFDRTLLPGFAFRYHKGKAIQEKLLVNKTAELILLSDAPIWYRVFFQKDPAAKILKRDILGFCGINVKKIKRIGEVGKLSKEQREKILSKI